MIYPHFIFGDRNGEVVQIPHSERHHDHGKNEKKIQTI
jgi:hypothetical protein